MERRSLGYSQTPLAKKLGMKEGFTISLINTPPNYQQLFTDFTGLVEITNDLSKKKDLIHFFVDSSQDLYKGLIPLKDQIKKNGMIWVSWPKKSSKIKTDVHENLIRSFALEIGLVDIKVCAVDETWSGLKLVIPLKDRK